MSRAHGRSFGCWLFTFTILLLVLILPPNGQGQSAARAVLEIPNIPGYLTLKCDFHVHTVFSDGLVWPTVRIEEAWRDGLDALALTDHLEYHPHKDDIPLNPNRPYVLALEDAQRLDILLIRGAEITREMPPGHLNAIFLEDLGPLIVPDYRKAVQAAVDQGAFVFWNHPDFPGPENQFIWNTEIEKLRAEGYLGGVEVANGERYYPEAQRWCLEKKLTMMADSDTHNPISMEYDLTEGGHRPMTLVFAEERTVASIKKALLARRTVVYWKNHLVGEAKFLKPIFQASVEVLNPNIDIAGDREALVRIRNRSDLSFELEPDGKESGPLNPSGLVLPPRKVCLMRVSAQAGVGPSLKSGTLHFRVKNLLVAPNEGLRVELALKANVVQSK